MNLDTIYILAAVLAGIGVLEWKINALHSKIDRIEEYLKESI